MNGVKSIFRTGFFRIILICLVGAIFCIAFGAIEFADSKKTPIDINELTKDDIKAGVIVEGDIYYNFGVCETIESTRNGRVESTTYRYVIPLADDTLFTISIVDSDKNKDTIAQLDKQTDETYDVVMGTLDDTTTIVHIKGKISKMGSEDYGYYKDFLKSGEYTEDEISTYGSEFYLTVRDFGQAGVIFIVGLVFLAVAVLLIFVSIRSAKKQAGAVPPSGTYTSQSSFAQTGMNQQMPQPGMPQPGIPQPGMNQQFGQQPQQFGQQPQQPQQPIQFGQQSQAPQPGVNMDQNNDPFGTF